VGLPEGEKNFEDMYNRLNTIPACDGQTNRRTDVLRRHSPRYAYASRGKNHPILVKFSKQQQMLNLTLVTTPRDSCYYAPGINTVPYLLIYDAVFLFGVEPQSVQI